jgi:hypothetical protein
MVTSNDRETPFNKRIDSHTRRLKKFVRAFDNASGCTQRLNEASLISKRRQRKLVLNQR